MSTATSISPASVCAQDPATTADKQVQDLVAKARVAQAAFESFSQEQVDAIVKGIGKYVYDNAEMLARTGRRRNRHRRLRGQSPQEQRQGPHHLEQPQGQEIARCHRRGPRNQPRVRGEADGGGRSGDSGDESHRHADVQRHVRDQDAATRVIFAPHPKAEKCTQLLTDEFMKVVKANGGPDNLVQMVRNGSIETTQELMKVVDVVVGDRWRGDGEGRHTRPAGRHSASEPVTCR